MNMENLPLAVSVIALEPAKYLVRVPLVIGAFFTAINVKKVITRAIALAFLIVLGLFFLAIGITQRTIVDILIGIGGIAAAIYIWWYTRA